LEIYFGPFERAVGLPHIPVNRDRITATYKDGFLQVSLPKRLVPEKPQKRMIPITTESGKSASPESGAQEVATNNRKHSERED
jgi:hypothetical protein